MTQEGMRSFLRLFKALERKPALKRHAWNSSYVEAEKSAQEAVVKECIKPGTLSISDQFILGTECIKDLRGTKADCLETGMTSHANKHMPWTISTSSGRRAICCTM